MSWPTGYEVEMNYPPGKLRAAHDQVAANFAALDFLERSRDVANEVVAQGCAGGNFTIDT